jgi:hypothetical protein
MPLMAKENFMRTNVKQSELKSLISVPLEMYSFWNPKEQKFMPNSLGPCDVDVEHGRAHYFLQTTDHRALAVCSRCYENTNKPNDPEMSPA